MTDITVRLARGQSSSSAARPTASVGHHLRRRGKSEEAEKIFRSCLQADERDLEAWIGMAGLLADRSKFDRAAYCLWRATQIARHDLSLLRDLGNLLIRAGDLNRACLVFGDLARRNPDDLQSQIAKSAVERFAGRIAQSRRTLDEAVRRNPVAAISALTSHPQRILRVFGVESAYYYVNIAPDGTPRIGLRDGHFSTEYFWNPTRYRTYDCLIAGDEEAWEAVVPPHDVLVNTIADPDVEAGSLRALARYLDKHPATPRINDPTRVLETSRDRNYDRLRGRPGIRFPKTVRLARGLHGRFDLETELKRHDLAFPIILREPGSHTARTTIRADDSGAAQRYLDERTCDEVYLIEYIDWRFRDDLYRKMRVFFIDGAIYPVVHHVDRVWNVHGFNRKDVMARTPWMMEMERSFVTDHETFLGSGVMERLKSLPALVGLDFFGVDFTVSEADELLIYEMNPAMRHSFDHATTFAYLEPSLRRISEAFRTMLLARCAV